MVGGLGRRIEGFLVFWAVLFVARPTCPHPSPQWARSPLRAGGREAGGGGRGLERLSPRATLGGTGRLRGSVVLAHASLPAQAEEPLLGGPLAILMSLGGRAARAVTGLRGEGAEGKARRGGERKEKAKEAKKKKKGKGEPMTQDELLAALVAACEEGRTVEVQRLIAQGADVNRRDAGHWYRWAPLHHAVAHARAPVVEVLLMAGAQVDMPDWDQWTPLHYAAWIGSGSHPAISRALLRYGANVHAQTWDGKTPLELAAYYENHGVADVLRSAARDERARRSLLRRFLGRPPRVRLDDVGIRSDREAFLEGLTRAYPEPVPQEEVDRYNKRVAKEKREAQEAAQQQALEAQWAEGMKGGVPIKVGSGEVPEALKGAQAPAAKTRGG